MAWTEGDVNVRGVRLHYYRRGSGRPVVLAHGFSDNGLCWDRVATVLESRYDVIAYDARFHGQSEAPADGSFGDGKDLAALVEALELDHPAALGHSMGAGTVAQAVRERPELFRCAILEDPPWRDEWPAAPRFEMPRWSELSVEQVIEYGQKQSPDWHPGEFPAWARSKQQLRVPADWSARRMGILEDWRPRVEGIGVPTLLIRGGNALRGAIVSREVAAEAQRLNSRIEVACFAQAGHNVRREAFAPYVAAVTAFLARY